MLASVRRHGARLLLAALALAACPIAAHAAGGDPVVVVYPLTTTGDASGREVGESIATALSQRLASLGGLAIVPPTPGTARANYLTAAVAESADYYVTGYATPLGNELSLVEQVVSTSSGSIVYSETALAKNYDEAIAPAAALRTAILSHAGRGYASIGAPTPPPPSPEPAPSNGGAFNLTKMLHRKRAAASASPTPAAVALAADSPMPAVAALALQTDGDANATELAYASATLVADLKASGRSTGTAPFGAGELVAHVGSICATSSASTRFYAGSLTVTHGAVPTVVYSLSVYDCTKASLKTIRTTESSPSNQPLDGAIRAAVGKAVAQIPR